MDTQSDPCWKGIPPGIRGFVLSTAGPPDGGFTTARPLQTISYTVTIPPALTDWVQPLGLPKFDPSLGVLLAVKLVLTGVNETSTQVTNPDPAPRSVVSGSDVTFCVLDPVGEILVSVIPVVRFINGLSGSDGSGDPGGSSSATNPPHSASRIGQRDHAAATEDLSGFVGVGTLGYRATAKGLPHHESADDPELSVQITGSLTLTLVYTYDACLHLRVLRLGEMPGNPGASPGDGHGDPVNPSEPRDRDQDCESMATKLSYHLVLFQLNLRHGFLKPAYWVETPGMGSGRCRAAELVEVCQVELLRHPHTPADHPGRHYQQCLKIALEGANRIAGR